MRVGCERTSQKTVRDSVGQEKDGPTVKSALKARSQFGTVADLDRLRKATLILRGT